jgi:thioredoxin-like negative regulator of GroEL
MFGPAFTQLLKKYTNQVLFVKRNTEEEQSIAAQFGNCSIPTLAFLSLRSYKINIWA